MLLVGNNKPKRIDQLSKYDIVLTTFQVCYCRRISNRYLFDHQSQTLAFEWPDNEVEEKARRTRKRKSKADSFIESDSSEEERILRKRKARKIPGLLFEMDVSITVVWRLSQVANPCCSGMMAYFGALLPY